MKTLNIIGAGHVGITLGSSWQQHGTFALQGILNRSLQSAQDACDLIQAGTAAESISDLPAADVWLLSVGDDQIEACAQHLASATKLRPQDIVFHCSGALPSSLLAACAASDALLASVHPVKTFPTADTDKDALLGSYCCMEGDADALPLLEQAFTDIGARVLRISAENKTLYHTGTVVACNYMVSLQEVALGLLTDAGLPRDEARHLLAPLLRATLENIIQIDTSAALTGPIARGDACVVSRQYSNLLEKHPRAAELYRLLGQTALELAEEKNTGDPQGLQSVRSLFTN